MRQYLLACTDRVQSETEKIALYFVLPISPPPISISIYRRVFQLFRTVTNPQRPMKLVASHREKWYTCTS